MTDLHARDIELDLVSRISALEIQVNSIITSQDKTSEKLDNILRETSRYKGFIGGVLFVGAALAAFIKLAVSSYLWKH